MCCFHLRFSDLNVLLEKNKKNLLQFTFEKKLVVQKEKKINLSQGKIKSQPSPPPDIKWSVPKKVTFSAYLLYPLINKIHLFCYA